MVARQLGMFDIQATTKRKYYDHIVLLHLESRRCRYRSIIFACLYLYITVDKTGSTETQFLRPNRKVVADRAGTNVRK
jgi:hypothetical protein